MICKDSGVNTLRVRLLTTFWQPLLRGWWLTIVMITKNTGREKKKPKNSIQAHLLVSSRWTIVYPIPNHWSLDAMIVHTRCYKLTSIWSPFSCPLPPAPPPPSPGGVCCNCVPLGHSLWPCSHGIHWKHQNKYKKTESILTLQKLEATLECGIIFKVWTLWC